MDVEELGLGRIMLLHAHAVITEKDGWSCMLEGGKLLGWVCTLLPLFVFHQTLSCVGNKPASLKLGGLCLSSLASSQDFGRFARLVALALHRRCLALFQPCPMFVHILPCR